MKKIIFFTIAILCNMQIIAQELPTVAGVTFGDNYEACKAKLDKRFNGGEDSHQGTSNELTYYNVNFAGESFSSASFFFQTNGNNTYLSAIGFFCKYNLRDLNHAKAKRDRLYKLFIDKYDFRWSNTNKNGLKYYVFGHSPNDENDGFVVVGISKEGTKDGDMKYWTQIIYGPVNFVNPTDEI